MYSPLEERSNDPPVVTSLCLVRIEQAATGRVVVTVSVSLDIATTALAVAGRMSSGEQALPLIADFLRRFGHSGSSGSPVSGPEKPDSFT